jgi:pyruvate formate lyase activating enzyme
MEARLYESQDEGKVRCALCHHRCVIREGKRGICGVRQVREGKLESMVYGKLIARHVDPIEKKPLFHFLPGSRSYSVATVGCNFKCMFCQNAEIAQMPSDHRGMIAGDACTPEEIVRDAAKTGCKSISYTYTEPTVYFEFALDTAIMAHKQGIRNVFVTNGYMTPEAIGEAAPFLNAANVDLKAFSEDFYRKICGGKLEPVKETLRGMKSRGIFVEVTTLLIPGLNDATEELTRLAGFLAKDLGPDTPWHVSRFHPTYRMTDRASTPVDTLIRARDTGIREGLRYVYIGNVPGEQGESTFCPSCGKILIERRGFRVNQNLIRKGRCESCGEGIAGVWE